MFPSLACLCTPPPFCYREVSTLSSKAKYVLGATGDTPGTGQIKTRACFHPSDPSMKLNPARKK